MNETIATMLAQMGGAGMVATMTGAQIVHDNQDNSVKLVFPKQQGVHQISHLVVKYNGGTDLYDLQGYRYNKRTFACPLVYERGGVYAEDLRRICEDVTGLYFSMGMLVAG